MATVVAKRLIDVDDYYKMAEVGILRPDDNVELINGEIINMSPIGSKHAGTINRLARILIEKLKGKAIVSIQNPIRLDQLNEPEPDIAILKPKSDDYFSSHPKAADVLLLIEVADTSIAFDREVKLPLYAKYQIPEYWIIDLISRKIEVYTNPINGSYPSKSIYGQDEILQFMEMRVNVGEVIFTEKRNK